MSESLPKAIPELLENTQSEVINYRNKALQFYKDLGPPDLVHVVKTNTKSVDKEVSDILSYRLVAITTHWEWILRLQPLLPLI